jgi:iron complex outermembrane receptor protein
MPLLLLFLLFTLVSTGATAAPAPEQQDAGATLRELSLEELGSVEVTTVSKRPEAVWRSAAAIYVLTEDDIRRSGATWRR